MNAIPKLSASPRGSSAVAGTQTNDSATFGNIGEFYQVLVPVGSPVAITTTNTPVNTATLALPNGDWDIMANANFAFTAVTQTGTQAGISQTSTTLPTDGSEVYSGVIGTLVSENDSVTLPRKRASLTSTAQSGGSAVAATDVITFTAHGFSNGQPLYFTALTGAAGLSLNTIYYVINTATNTFKLALTSGGSAIDVTTTGSAMALLPATLIYLVSQVSFSAKTTINTFGQISARRVR